MEISSAKWLSELEMEEFAYQYQMNPYDYTLDELSFPTRFSAELDHNRASVFHVSSVQTTPYSVVERPPAKKVDSRMSCPASQLAYITSASSSPQFISFGDSNSCRADSEKFDDGVNYGTALMGVDGDRDFSFLISPSSGENQNYHVIGCGDHEITTAATSNRSLVQARDHVIAERKRREKLSQWFVALSALIPGLKKKDKASVLGGAIKYVKELQGRMKWAEEEIAAKRVIESVVLVKRTNLPSENCEDETSSSDDRHRVSIRPVSDIETRVSDKDILIRIHCQKGKVCLSNILSRIEKLNVSVVNSCVLPFGHSRLDITIVAQMDVDFCMTATDLRKKLREALVELI